MLSVISFKKENPAHIPIWLLHDILVRIYNFAYLKRVS